MNNFDVTLLRELASLDETPSKGLSRIAPKPHCDGRAASIVGVQQIVDFLQQLQHFLGV